MWEEPSLAHFLRRLATFSLLLCFDKRVLNSTGVEMPRLGGEWPLLERLCEHHRLTANDIPDAWIAAAVMTHHDHLVSFDKGFRRFLKTNEFTVLQP